MKRNYVPRAVRRYGTPYASSRSVLGREPFCDIRLLAIVDLEDLAIVDEDLSSKDEGEEGTTPKS